ncbi:hypothetical protein SAMN06265795_102234 [Noviherbaspirillum humi]|uniref:Uncharacterized protein n=2 Tax=Noviherbaspirillum humi TaxID=1688639 RepID=A0A239DK48_9BURK|nr:hypothetical protein SAMN06265795_102234 [Noviherbaspirillum humi]
MHRELPDIAARSAFKPFQDRQAINGLALTDNLLKVGILYALPYARHLTNGPWRRGYNASGMIDGGNLSGTMRDESG